MNRYEELADRLRHWKPPAELATPGPREVEITAGGITLLVLSGLLVLGGIAAGFFLWNDATGRAAFQQRLAGEGVTAQAVVTRLYRGRGDSSDRFVTYQFEFDGAIYRSNSKVPRRIWNTLKEGQSLTVRFVPADPARSRPVDWSTAGPPAWVALIPASGLIALAGLFIWSVRRAHRLLSEGRAAPGIVVRHSKAKQGQYLHYEFPLLNGSMGSGKSDPERNPAPVGDAICIIYDRDNPKRNTTYPMQLFRVRGAASRGRARL